ncbi:MAG: hypothetical protein QF483_05110 [Gammaproteobacteria bacterium]|nr:hypothetical protein [Gammaproteobacteria bacterium]
MTESCPIEPAGWTASLGPPTLDSVVPLKGRRNPVVKDKALAALYVAGVKDRIRKDIPYRKQAVVLMNHHLRANQQYFDPKINDTLVLHKNIRKLLKRKYRGLKAKNILGAWFGRKETKPNIIPAPPTFSQQERTRNMRAEALDDSVTEDCCFVMGGCPVTGQPYPPERQSLATRAISQLDSHLGFDVSEYGHLGYDSAAGAPDVNAPGVFF